MRKMVAFLMLFAVLLGVNYSLTTMIAPSSTEICQVDSTDANECAPDELPEIQNDIHHLMPSVKVPVPSKNAFVTEEESLIPQRFSRGLHRPPDFV